MYICTRVRLLLVNTNYPNSRGQANKYQPLSHYVVIKMGVFDRQLTHISLELTLA